MNHQKSNTGEPKTRRSKRNEKEDSEETIAPKKKSGFCKTVNQSSNLN